MRIQPENSEQAQIRAKLREKPKSTAQIKHLTKNFKHHAATGHVELAHTALNLLPKEQQNKLDKSTYFSQIIEQDRADLMDEVRQHGTPQDKAQFNIERLKLEEKQHIDSLLTSMIQTKAKKETKPQSREIFSRMKDKLNNMIGRSSPIVAEELSQKSDISDDKTDSISNHSNDTSDDHPEHDHTRFDNRI
ncbi:MAG: hypothetical protein P1U39_02210 [Legionellaceae bacterium]|nr:hypothetical protein [Legionellaceae bacterium]